MRRSMVLAFDRTEQRSDQQPERPTPQSRVQRPAEPDPAPPRRVRRRRRWPVALAATAALGAVFAPPPGHHLSAVAQLNDASLPWDAAAAQQNRQLSGGAPAGALTLTAMPVRVAQTQPAGPPEITGLAANGIPNVALNAYRVAAARMANADPGCGIDWSLLAGIGRVESNHGRFGGATLNPDGSTTPKIIGPPLDGGQFAYIGDTDGGTWDGDSRYDRAVGPMQFIPSTWRAYAVDGDGNGTTDPTNINDAALGAAHYLCVAGGDLRTSAGQHRAVMAYNHSDSYVAEVLALAAAYASGISVADLPPLVGNTSGAIPAPSGFWAAPAAPGPAMGARDTTTSSGDTTYSQDIPPATTASSGGSSPNGSAAAPAASGSGGSGGSSGTAAGTSSAGGSGSSTGGTTGSTGGNAGSPAAPAPAGGAPAPGSALPSVSLPVTPPPVAVPTTPTVPSSPPPAPTVPQVVDPVTGALVDAVRGVTCDDLALTALPACPAGV